MNPVDLDSIMKQKIEEVMIKNPCNIHNQVSEVVVKDGGAFVTSCCQEQYDRVLDILPLTKN